MFVILPMELMTVELKEGTGRLMTFVEKTQSFLILAAVFVGLAL